jgi:hypothetical protein
MTTFLVFFFTVKVEPSEMKIGPNATATLALTVNTNLYTFLSKFNKQYWNCNWMGKVISIFPNSFSDFVGKST